MNTGKKYNTKQKAYIMECIENNADDYITTQQVYDYLKGKGEQVGLTTIYRNLTKLEKEGIIARVNIDGMNGICYRYLPQKEKSILFYLKCEKCGNLININCPELEHLYSHLSEDHHIYINPGKTMFYGICEKCI